MDESWLAFLTDDYIHTLDDTRDVEAYAWGKVCNSDPVFFESRVAVRVGG